MDCYNTRCADKLASDNSGDKRYEEIEALAYQALDHDYLELIVNGIDNKNLCDFKCYQDHMYSIASLAMQSTVAGIRHAAQVVVRHGLDTDLDEKTFNGEQARELKSQMYLAAEIKSLSGNEVFGADLLLLACHKYAHADDKIKYELIQLWQDIYGEQE